MFGTKYTYNLDHVHLHNCCYLSPGSITFKSYVLDSIVMMRLVLVFFPLKGFQKPSETDRMGPKVNAWKHHMALVDNLQLTQGTMTQIDNGSKSCAAGSMCTMGTRHQWVKQLHWVLCALGKSIVD